MHVKKEGQANRSIASPKGLVPGVEHDFRVLASGVAGQMVHWVARWTNTRSQHGPWSDTVSATVVG